MPGKAEDINLETHRLGECRSQTDIRSQNARQYHKALGSILSRGILDCQSHKAVNLLTMYANLSYICHYFHYKGSNTCVKVDRGACIENH